ncbi:endonuclease/exonuclease/phosphatase family protein, partial [Trifolium medium]|nr:endonuclease/exonuclease/phosphatase family protein [Trifolium medium]
KLGHNKEGRVSLIQVDEPLIREVEQAKKLIAIQEDHGIKFKEEGEEDLKRVMMMEGRDRREKKDWEEKKVDKRWLWNDILMSKQGFGGDIWCVVGDFNSVRDLEERRSCGQSVINGSSRDMVEFHNFLGGLGLIDMPLISRRFTWFHPNGVSMSRIDRVLLSME